MGVDVKMFEAEVAIRSYRLYFNKYLTDEAAFPLPNFFIEARKIYGKEEAAMLWSKLDIEEGVVKKVRDING